MGIEKPAADAAAKSLVLGIPVSLGGMGEVAGLMSAKSPQTAMLVTFVNPLACKLAKLHSDYTDLLAAFDRVACDGIGMIKAAHASGLDGLKREAFDFTSKADEVFRWALANGASIGLVGGKPGVALEAGRLLREKYPGLAIDGCYSGYGQDPEDALVAFTSVGTDVVICGMGAPLQERFLVRLTARNWHGAGFTCGGFFDQLRDKEDYYPAWVDRRNLRFLYRLAKEPRRLWRRYLVEYLVFLRAYAKLRWSMVKARLHGKPPGDQNA